MKEYEMPIGTKVEIINENSRYNGRIGTLGAKDPSGMPDHNVWFDNEEFDCFMDDEFLPIQNIIVIDKLDYETLSKVFEHDYIYETDRIVIKQKKFTHEEMKKALLDFTNTLLEGFGKDEYKNKCGKIIDLLVYMLSCDEDDPIAIQETLLFEQWWIDGLRNYSTKGCKTGKKRYFNPEAKIETIFI